MYNLGPAVTWIIWVVFGVGLLLFLSLLSVFLWQLPRMVRNAWTWVMWRRFWRRHGNYVPAYWEKQVQR